MRASLHRWLPLTLPLSPEGFARVWGEENPRPSGERVAGRPVRVAKHEGTG